MAYSYLKLGAEGDEVKTLQKLLSANGFETRADGVFGNETEKAVKAYQAANQLTADGAANEATWAKLTAPGERRGAGYTPPNLSAAAKVTYLEQNRPGAYESGYARQIDELLNQVMRREAFDYDPANDEMYKRYRDQYTYQGEKAMNHAIGVSSALSGGYANSYAASAGNQAYQDYMAALGGEIPALYKLALSAYDAEGDRLESALSQLSDADAAAYKRYLDDTDAYNDALDYYYKKLKDEQAQAGKKSSGASAAAKAEPTPPPASPPPPPLANILTEYEFFRRKSAGAASLKPYADYAEYVAAMERKYSAK